MPSQRKVKSQNPASKKGFQDFCEEKISFAGFNQEDFNNFYEQNKDKILTEADYSGYGNYFLDKILSAAVAEVQE